MLHRGNMTGLAAGVLHAVGSVAGHVPRPVPLHEPEFRGREWELVKDCLDSGWVSSAGSYVGRFEAALAGFTGAAHAVATINGTAALHLCVRLAGVQHGDEVLLPALTFVATANAVASQGAIPHFVDSEEMSLGVDPALLDSYLAEIATVRGDRCINLRTGAVIRALIVVHAFGHPADMAQLEPLARRWRLVLIEDAAEALGSRIGEKHAGNFSHLAALSFNGNKIVTTGSGGAVLANDPDLAARARHLSTTARVSDRWTFVHDEVGYNFRLANLNAALGCAQMEQLPSFLERKRRVAHRYRAAFKQLQGVTFVDEPAGTSSNFWLNTIMLDRGAAPQRDAVLEALVGAGYGARPVWRLMHRLPMFQSAPRMPLHVAESLEARVINLPSSARLADPRG